ncbi:MAG: RDD family protein [Candidatus Baltobacteraceae bacterium]
MFSYELAGLGSRFLAVLVDLLIQTAVLLAIFFGILALAAHGVAIKHSQAVETLAQSLAVAIVVIVVFLLFFGYFIAFEALWNGQTPGKRLLGIRVVRDGGYPVDTMSSLIRNLIRVIELALGFYALSVVSTLISHENKRLGDFAAGTIVVRETRAPLDFVQFLTSAETPAFGAASATLPQHERALVMRFIDRRDDLVNGARVRLAHDIAQQLRPKLPPELAGLSDEALLERLSVS